MGSDNLDKYGNKGYIWLSPYLVTQGSLMTLLRTLSAVSHQAGLRDEEL